MRTIRLSFWEIRYPQALPADGYCFARCHAARYEFVGLSRSVHVYRKFETETSGAGWLAVLCTFVISFLWYHDFSNFSLILLTEATL